MTLEVEVNVMVDNVRWIPGMGWYTGQFIFQQVSPLSPIVVDKRGNINLPKAGVTEDIAVTYHWASTAVEIEGDLYPADIADPPGDSYWILPGNAKPKASDLPPAGDGDITVGQGSGPSRLVMKDSNKTGKFYTYCLALRVGIDGGQWLVADPKIVNKGTSRLMSYQSGDQAD